MIKRLKAENERCDVCNSEMSDCGPLGVDGAPTLDCQVCSLKERIADWHKLNDKLEKILPVTFYAGLGLHARIDLMCSHWRSAIEVNHELQVKNDSLEAMFTQTIDAACSRDSAYITELFRLHDLHNKVKGSLKIEKVPESEFDPMWHDQWQVAIEANNRLKAKNDTLEESLDSAIKLLEQVPSTCREPYIVNGFWGDVQQELRHIRLITEKGKE